MSLPIPSTAPPSSLDPRQVQAMDAPLIALTQQCNGDLRQLMHAFFSFLNRRTDFYLVPHPDDVAAGVPLKMGFREGDAERLLLAAFRQFPLRRIPKGGGGPTSTTGGGGAAPKVAAAVSGTASTPAAATDAKQPNASPSSSEPSTTTTVPSKTTKAGEDTNDDVTTTPSSLKENDDAKPKDAPATKGKNEDDIDDPNTSIASNMRDVRYNDDNGLQIPVGNGGSTPRYKWTQTLEETTVLIGVPKTLRGKDFDVTLSPTRMSVKAKKPLPGETSPRTFVEGEWVETIRPDESTWSVEGVVMILTLDKVKKTFWTTVIKGDEQIDGDLVDSRRYISDYDEATQGQIRKIIFDQNQYHKGLPNSDEILGTKPKIPELPPGVEYIDQKKLDEVNGKGKESK